MFQSCLRCILLCWIHDLSIVIKRWKLHQFTTHKFRKFLFWFIAAALGQLIRHYLDNHFHFIQKKRFFSTQCDELAGIHGKQKEWTHRKKNGSHCLGFGHIHIARLFRWTLSSQTKNNKCITPATIANL